MKRVLTPLAVRSAEAVLGYAWLALGVQGAGNILTVWVLGLFCLSMLVVFFGELDGKGVEPRRPMLSLLNRIFLVLAVVALAWFGELWLAAAYATAWLFFSAHQRANRIKAEQGAANNG